MSLFSFAKGINEAKDAGERVMGFDFLQATPKERFIIILTLVGLLAVAGVLYLYDKRKKKK
ncbi:MAG TPA: LPXTG cell wall anchor domain-containing protein [Desulfosporosinus sp.]|nr:LPXTG cell wall anchor domain-containing protein [Desulfosporosinus sp.]